MQCLTKTILLKQTIHKKRMENYKILYLHQPLVTLASIYNYKVPLQLHLKQIHWEYVKLNAELFKLSAE